MIYFFICYLFVVLVLHIVLTKKIYSPGVIFNGMFFLTFFLYSFRLSYIQNALVPKTILIFFLSNVAFNIPLLVKFVVEKRKAKKVGENLNLEKPENQNLNQKEDDFNFELPSKLQFGIFLFVLIAFFVEVIYSRGFPVLWKLTKSPKTYVDFGIPFLHGLLNSLIMLMGAYSLPRKKCYYKYFYLLVSFLIISRQLIVSIIIEGILLYLITKKNKPKYFWWLVSATALLLVVGFSIFGNFRTGESAFLQVVNFRPKFAWLPTSFKWIYSYMCYSVSNFNNLVVMTTGAVNFGMSSLSLIVPSALRRFFVPKLELNYLVYPNFTVSTFAPSLYLDFGVTGVVLFCLVLGVLITLIDYATYKKSGIFALVYMVFLHNIIFLFFSNMFLNLSVVTQIVWIPIIFVLCKNIFEKKSKKVIKKEENL